MFISADTFKDERSRDPNGDPHYKVTLAVDQSKFTERQKGLEIKPGMQADVELETGGKTILTYLTKPLYKSNEALRERSGCRNASAREIAKIQSLKPSVNACSAISDPWV